MKLALLYGVSEFVCQQSLTASGSGTKSSGTEHDIFANGVGERIDGSRRFRCPLIGMNPHPTQVMAEARLEESAGTRV